MKRDTPERNIMAFIEFFEEDDSGNWREQLEEIRLRCPGTYEDYAKEKAVRPPTDAMIKREAEKRQIAKFERAAAACDEWERLHPQGVVLTAEDEAHTRALEMALLRALPPECDDCGTYCDGFCDSPQELVREGQYLEMLANVERWAGVVTLQDRLRARLSLGAYRYTNTDAIINALLDLTAVARVLISTDSDGITLTNECGHSWFLLPVDFVDCAKSGVATFEDDFWAEIRGDESPAVVELD